MKERSVNFGLWQAKLTARLRLIFAISCLTAAPVDVIDLLGNTGSFHLTPFLLLSMLYLIFCALEELSRGALGLSPRYVQLFDSTSAVVALFILLIWTSVLFRSADTQNLGLSRAIYTTWLVIFARLFVAHQKLSLPLVVAWAMRLFIIADAICVVIQLVAVFNSWSLPGVVYGLAVDEVANLFRPGGLVLDPNRSSIVLVLLMTLTFVSRDHLRERDRVGRSFYILGIILSLLALSRTGMVSLAIFASLPFMRSRNKLKILGASLLSIIVLAGSGVLYLSSTKNLSSFVEESQLSLFSSDQRQKSSSEHFQLIANGTSEFLGSAKIFIVGSGWGTEYEFTKEFFGDSKNGNFHCEYVSIAVQTGIFGLFCLLFLIAKPLLLGLEWRPLTVVMLWSCTFYQYHGDPFWWVAIMIMCTPLTSRLGYDRILTPAQTAPRLSVGQMSI